MTLQDNSHKLDSLIEQNKSFAIFRLPEETAPSFVMQTSGEPKQLFDIDELNLNKGFVIAPFRISEDKPVLIIRPDINNLDAVEITSMSPIRNKVKSEKIKNSDRNEYYKLFQKFYEPLKEGEIKKLVLSRSKSIPKSKNFSAGETFYRAMEKYKHSCVFLFHTPISGTWIGSTPEIILSGSGNKWQTVAIAGTRYPNKGNISWDDKNLLEQHLVTSYLLNQLSSFKISPEINGPYTTKAANLAHLKTDLFFTLPNSCKLGKLLKSLHPTPAVSGLPKVDAYRFIDENEGYDRGYYTGFLGMIDKDNKTNIYVNLRSMKVGESLLTLFSGSGLVPASNCKDEWKEIEQKFKTMTSIVY